MSVVLNIKSRQRSIDLYKQSPSSHYFKRPIKIRCKQNTRSLHSIETNRCSLNLANRQQRRKLLSIPATDTKPITERPSPYDQTSKKSTNKVIQVVRSRTIEDRDCRNERGRERNLEDKWVQKEIKIKNCIELMQGVLEEIKNQRSHNNCDRKKEQNCNQTFVQKGSESRFQNYVKNVCKLKQDSRAVVIRKNKTKSHISLANIQSSIDVKQTLQKKSYLQKKDQSQKGGRENKQQNKIILEREKLENKEINNKVQKCVSRIDTNDMQKPLGEKIEEIDFSQIIKINQSSFMSDLGKNFLVRNLENKEQKETIDCNNKKILKIKNNKMLKNLFPCDFF